MNHIDHIYIIVSKHYESTRYQYLQDNLAPLFNTNYITFFEPYYKGRDSIDMITSKLGTLKHRLSIGAGMLYMTYYKLLLDILESKYQTVLILESDVLFDKDNLINNINQVINDWIQLKDRNSMIFLGNGCNFKPSKNQHISNTCLYKTNASKCTDSMIWTNEVCQSLLKNMFPIELPIDLHINQVSQSNQFNCYWIENPIFIQGSQNGTYQSTIS